MAAEVLPTSSGSVGDAGTMNVAPSSSSLSSQYSSFAGNVAAQVGQFGLTWFNNYLAGERDREARAWNSEQARIANQWSIDQWNRENEYNSPAAQMARLREAGINPALAYANGAFNQSGSSPSVTSAAGSGQAAKVMPFQLDPMLYSNLETAAAQRELMNAEAKEKEANARLSESRVPLASQEILESKSRISDINKEIEKKAAEIKVLSADEKLRLAQKGKIEFDKVMESKKYLLDKKEIEARIKLYEKEGKAYEAASARDLSQKALNDVELNLLKDTYADIVFGIKMENQAKGADFAALQAKLDQLGISINYETGEITVETGGYTEMMSSDFMQYAKGIAELLGSIVGVVVPFTPVGKATGQHVPVRGFVRSS